MNNSRRNGSIRARVTNFARLSGVIVKRTIARTINTVANYYYYASGGIGTPNLTPRYSIYYPVDFDSGIAYIYMKTVDNHISVPPFTYASATSQYNIHVPIHKLVDNSLYSTVVIPLNKLEFGGDSTNLYSWLRYSGWSTVTNYEQLRNSWIRVKKSDLTDLGVLATGTTLATFGNTYYYNDNLRFSYTETWGTSFYPDGISYGAGNILPIMGQSWSSRRKPQSPTIDSIVSDGGGQITVTITFGDTGGIPIYNLFIMGFDPTGATSQFTRNISTSLEGQPLTTTFVVTGLTVGAQHTIKVFATNGATSQDVGVTSMSALSSVFTV